MVVRVWRYGSDPHDARLGLDERRPLVLRGEPDDYPGRRRRPSGSVEGPAPTVGAEQLSMRRRARHGRDATQAKRGRKAAERWAPDAPSKRGEVLSCLPWSQPSEW